MRFSLSFRRIGPIKRWQLKRKGMKDGANKAFEKSREVSGKYYSGFIGSEMAYFKKIENDKFTWIRNELKDLNISIKNLNQQRKDENASADLKISKVIEKIDEIKDNTRIRELKREISKIKSEKRITINSINKEASEAENRAHELIKDFNVGFYEGLTFCRCKLAIYWEYVFIQCKSKNKDTEITAVLPTEDELMRMCNVKNPSEDFEIESYEEEIEAN
jgi:hypothetical protein